MPVPVKISIGTEKTPLNTRGFCDTIDITLQVPAITGKSEVMP
jgi:hypothetical protein